MRSKVAQALEVTELAVTRIETGEERLTAGGLILLLRLFDLSWDEFMRHVESNLGKAEAEII
jgi:transcriptional regulator with XRE-family HTH domain